MQFVGVLWSWLGSAAGSMFGGGAAGAAGGAGSSLAGGAAAGGGIASVASSGAGGIAGGVASSGAGGIAGGAVGGAAGGAAGGGLFSANNLGMMNSALSGMSSMRSGGASKAQLEDQAYQVQLKSRQDAISSVQKANDILENAINSLAKQRAAFAGAGVSETGSARKLMLKDQDTAQGEIDLTRMNSRINQYMLERSRRSLIQQGKSADTEGMLGMARAGISMFSAMKNRG